MDLHLHLTVAFRALDKKWHSVDLDTDEEPKPCNPAVIDVPNTTFCSEDYLNSIRRKPYSRVEVESGKKENDVLRKFHDISKIPVIDSDYHDYRVDENSDGKSLKKTYQVIEKDPVKNIFKSMKSCAKSYVRDKCRIKVRNWAKAN